MEILDEVEQFEKEKIILKFKGHVKIEEKGDVLNEMCTL